MCACRSGHFHFVKFHPRQTTDTLSVVLGIIAAAKKLEVLKIFIFFCGSVCVSLQWGNNTDRLPCVI